MAGDQQVYRATLRSALDIKGAPALAEYLRVRRSILYAWLGGVLPIPDAVFFKLAEIVSDEEARLLHPPPASSGDEAKPKA